MAKWLAALVVAPILTAFAWGNAMAAGPTPHRHAAVTLIASETAATPGKTLTVAVWERLEPGWHTYWINPGDSGEPTAVEWTLPAGVSAGPILWPLPHTIMVGPLAEYGYDDEVLLLTEIQVPEQASGSITLTAKVTYLICKDICVPEEARVELTLPVASEARPSEFAGKIAQARAALPKPLPGTATYAANPAKGALRLTVSADPALFAGVKEARFFPLTWGPVSNPSAQPMQIAGGQLIADLKQGESKETPSKLEGLLVLTKDGGERARTGYTVSAARGPDSAAAGGLIDHADGAGQANSKSLAAAPDGVYGSTWIALLFAFLSGIILNAMPCVFPVLALKALGLAKAANGGHRQQGIAYLAGVLVSFAALAAAIAILRETAAKAADAAPHGDGAGGIAWGFQFHSPSFVLVLALLFFVMGLSLSGVFSFGSGLMGVGGNLARRPGNAGYFFTGALAAIAATPCTAPLMGAAIGFAVKQPAHILLAVMLSLGLRFRHAGRGPEFQPRLAKVPAEARSLDGDAEAGAGFPALRDNGLARVCAERRDWRRWRDGRRGGPYRSEFCGVAGR